MPKPTFPTSLAVSWLMIMLVSTFLLYRQGQRDQTTEILSFFQAQTESLSEPVQPPPERKFMTEKKVLELIRDDLNEIEKSDPGKLPRIRYFTTTHLYNAILINEESRGLKKEEIEKVLQNKLDKYHRGLSMLLNSLSWAANIKQPLPVKNSQNTIFRIELDWYMWDAQMWNHILASYPYGINYLTDATAKAIYDATDCELPYVRADWFAFVASRPPLYHEILGLPGTDRELEQRLKVDVANDIAFPQDQRAVRAGFNDSAVSWNNRLIERHRFERRPGQEGSYWKSYDFIGNKGRKNLFAFPLGPSPGENTFQHDAAEIIFNLPNSLPAYMLVNGNGNRLDEAPLEIVQDTERHYRIVNGISCMSCHWRGPNALPFKKHDQIRNHIEKNPNQEAFSADERKAILDLYPTKDKLDALLKKDAGLFKQAVRETGTDLDLGYKGEKLSDQRFLSYDPTPIISLAMNYEYGMDLAQAAAEMGLEPEVFDQRLARAPKFARILGVLHQGGMVKRQVFEDAFPLLLHEWGYGGYSNQEVKLRPVTSIAGKDKESSTPPNKRWLFWLWLVGSAGLLGLVLRFVFWNKPKRPSLDCL